MANSPHIGEVELFINAQKTNKQNSKSRSLFSRKKEAPSQVLAPAAKVLAIAVFLTSFYYLEDYLFNVAKAIINNAK